MAVVKARKYSDLLKKNKRLSSLIIAMIASLYALNLKPDNSTIADCGGWTPLSVDAQLKDFKTAARQLGARKRLKLAIDHAKSVGIDPISLLQDGGELKYPSPPISESESSESQKVTGKCKSKKNVKGIGLITPLIENIPLTPMVEEVIGVEDMDRLFEELERLKAKQVDDGSD